MFIIEGEVMRKTSYIIMSILVLSLLTSFTLGTSNKYIIINEEEIIADSSTQVIEEKTVVPARFEIESSGVKEDWDKTISTALVYSEEIKLPEEEKQPNNRVECNYENIEVNSYYEKVGKDSCKLVKVYDKNIYEFIENEFIISFKNRENRISLPSGVTTVGVLEYLSEILKQHPEIDIELSRERSVIFKKGKEEYVLIEYSDEYDISKIDLVIEECLELLKENHSDEDKAKIILDFVISRIKYCDSVKKMLTNGVDIAEYHDSSVFDHWGLVTGDAVCGGYSRAYKVIADKAGLETHLIRGYALGIGSKDRLSEYSEKDINHMWLKIKLDDKWYHIDPTWADSESKELKKGQYYMVEGKRFYSASEYDKYKASKYFKLTDIEIARTHPFWLEYKLK